MNSKNNKSQHNVEQQQVARIVAREPGWEADFADLAATFEPYLHARCLRRLGEPADAADVVQEVLLIAYRKLHQFAGRSSLKTWLTRIADNQCTALQRKQSRYLLSDHFEELIEHLEHCPSTQPASDDQSRVIAELMRSLSEQAREVIALRYWSDLSVEQVGGILGLGKSATKMRAHRAVVECRTLLERRGRLLA